MPRHPLSVSKVPRPMYVSTDQPSASCAGRQPATRTWRGILLLFQRNISHRYMRPQFVFAVAVILQRLAQPAAGLAVAIPIYVADAGAGLDQPVARVPGVNPNVANA